MSRGIRRVAKLLTPRVRADVNRTRCRILWGFTRSNKYIGYDGPRKEAIAAIEQRAILQNQLDQVGTAYSRF